MNGAESLVRALAAAGVDLCFTNPGTSELHVVAGFDAVPEVRPVLALFEGVATGAADGFARVTGRPAATLLHLGPGLANGLANLHNARRARVPLVNIVGDHPDDHLRLDPPLATDVAALAATVSGWIRRCAQASDVAADTADAVAASLGPPGCVATLVLPADVSWSPTDSAPPVPRPRRRLEPPTAGAVESAAAALRSGERALVLLGGGALHERGLLAAARATAASGAGLLCETFPADLERGAGLPALERLAYLPEFAEAQLSGVRHLILAGAEHPVAFFAYEGRRGDLVPSDCQVHLLAGPAHDAAAALEGLAESVGAVDPPVLLAASRPDRPTGRLTAESLAAAVGALLPEGSIVVDEGNTEGIFVPGATAGAPRHDWLTLTGGAIGQGLPVATGAALGAPGRRVLSLEADGSALYTVQALWTQARESLDVTTVVLVNRSYAILSLERSRVAPGDAGPRSAAMLDLSGPDLDYVSLAAGFGVPGWRARSAEEFTVVLERALNEPGPSLVEAVLTDR